MLLALRHHLLEEKLSFVVVMAADSQHKRGSFVVFWLVCSSAELKRVALIMVFGNGGDLERKMKREFWRSEEEEDKRGWSVFWKQNEKCGEREGAPTTWRKKGLGFHFLSFPNVGGQFGVLELGFKILWSLLTIIRQKLDYFYHKTFLSHTIYFSDIIRSSLSLWLN